MKASDAKPTKEQYQTAWRCFVKLLTILKPIDCIILGIRNEKYSGYKLEELGIKDYINNDFELENMNINSSTPRKRTIVFNDGYSLDFHIIHHPSQYYSPDLWYNFLKEQMPEAVNWLNK